ncbi:uncharacterized protein LOC141613155 [Silene latifolia]|uniref:uncharacterized protein LOC141613155 n=1 Tax=Silene latifolia TaxID=37657 RepID=UPI003D775DE5
MGYLVGDHQNAFVSGRHISDNILLAHEAIHKINSHKKGKHGFFAYKTDMSKAYDRVNWNFLQVVLTKFGFPEKIIKLIMNCVIQFLMRSGNSLHWCSRLFTSLPKSEGGLGIRNIECLNKALLAKHAWRLVTNEKSAFCSVFRGKIFGIRGCHSDLTYGSRGITSWGTKSVLYGLNFILDNLCWRPGVRSNLNVWNSKWVNGSNPEPVATLLSPEFNFLKDLRVRDLTSGNERWNEGLIKLLFEEESANRILAIPLSATQIEDEVIWPFSRNGKYNVKSGYALIFKDYYEVKASITDRSRISDERKRFCKSKLWRLPGPQTWKILIWKIITNSLPVGWEFVKRNMGRDATCPLCQKESREMETIDHLFRDCTFVSRIWASSPLGISTSHLPNTLVGDWIINWICYLSRLKGSKSRIILFLAVVVGIWNCRNGVIFRGVKANPYSFFIFYNYLVSLVFKALKEDDDRKEDKTMGSCQIEQELENDLVMIKEGRPVYGVGNFGSCTMTRVKVDASWDKSGKAGIGWIAVQEGGGRCFEGSLKCRAESLIQAETLGVKEVILWARGCGILHLEISSDCLQLILQWAGNEDQHYQIKGLLDDIGSLSSYFHCLCLSYVCRVSNGDAHRLARRALQAV